MAYLHVVKRPKNAAMSEQDRFWAIEKKETQQELL